MRERLRFRGPKFKRTLVGMTARRSVWRLRPPPIRHFFQFAAGVEDTRGFFAPFAKRSVNRVRRLVGRNRGAVCFR